MMLLRVAAIVFALLSLLAAEGWALTASVPHALGWLAASVLAFLLSTLPIGNVA